MTDVPSDYLRWMLDSCDLWDATRQAIEEVLRRRYAEPEGDEWDEPPPRGSRADSAPARLAEGVRTWYRRMTLRYHPDRGGSTEAMQVIVDAHNELRRELGIR